MAQDAPDAFPASGPQVGLFIPVRNGELYLEECITSILRQTFTDWRLTIVDNCSTDATRSIVERHASDSRIMYFCNEENLGAIGNFNRCLEMVNTNFYSILSHDDFFRLPDTLEQALWAMRTHPEIGVVYSDVEWVDGAGARIAEKRMPFRGQVAGQEISRRCLTEGRNHFGVPVLLRTKDVRGLRYDPAFPLTGDIDFSIACAGRAQAYFLPRPAIAIRFHSGNGTMRSFKGTRTEFPALAQKHGIQMGRLSSLRFRLHDALNTCKKRAFFFYLDHLRTRNPG